MLITKISKYSGLTHVMDLPITEQQVRNFNLGMKVQDAFPLLNSDQREFMLTGCTKEEWDEMFQEDDHD